MDRAIHKHSAPILATLFAFSFLAFWPAYLSGALIDVDWRVHFHAVTLALWCVLMITQAYLIRTNRRPIHRWTGKLSYLLAPLVVLASLSAVHGLLQREGVDGIWAYALAFVLGLVAQFVFAYALAIYHRKNPALHARFMICTAFPMIPPILDRVLLFYLLPPDRAGFLPSIEGIPLYELVPFVLTDVILVALSIWDWRSRSRINVFPVVLAAFVLFQVLPLLVYRAAFWDRFSLWFLSLPL